MKKIIIIIYTSYSTVGNFYLDFFLSLNDIDCKNSSFWLSAHVVRHTQQLDFIIMD